jgi:hypothetical protein
MNPSQNILLNIEGRHVRDLCNPDLGATVVKLESFPHVQMLGEIMAFALNAGFTPAKSLKLESNYSFKCLPVDRETVWTGFAKELARILNSKLCAPLEIAEPLIFDDLYLTSYHLAPHKGALGVGPHRDVNCKGLVAVVILTGELPSYVCKEKDRTGSVYLPVRKGELLLMRADRCGNLPKPLHYVGEVTDEAVVQFGMRQYINTEK